MNVATTKWNKAIKAATAGTKIWKRMCKHFKWRVKL